MLAPIVLLAAGKRFFTAPRKVIVWSLLVGAIGLAGSNFFYYYAIQKTSVAPAIVLQYCAPIWVLIYMVARKLQRATPARMLGVAFAVVGIALAIGLIGHAPLHLDLLGALAAEAAGVCFAFYNVAGSALVHRTAPLTVFLYASLGAALLWVVLNPPWRVVHEGHTAPQWAFLFAFAAISMLLPFLLYLSGLRRLDATSAIVTSCLEPVFAIVLAAIFVREHIGWLQAVGIALVLAATVIIQKPATEAHVTEPEAAHA